MKRALSLPAFCVALASDSSHAYIVTGFGAEFYNADTATMDVALGETWLRAAVSATKNAAPTPSRVSR